MQRRHVQGLCSNCNERFTARHKCSKAQLLIFDSESKTEEATYDESSIEEQRTVPETNVEPQITYYALTGWAAPQTMRVKARIGSQEIVVLIDSRSTHNFINTKLANMLRLAAKPTTAFSVRVANGDKLIRYEKFENVSILVQEIPFSLTVYSLPITGLEIVLGVQWLEMLGSVVCNWKSLTMEFSWGNKECRLQGLRSQPVQSTSLA